MHNHNDAEEFVKKLMLMNSIKDKCKNLTLKRAATREIIQIQIYKFCPIIEVIQIVKKEILYG